MGRIHLRRISRFVTGSIATLGVALAGPASAAPAAVAVFHPTVADYVQMSTSTTPPTEAQCMSVGRTCFTPQAIQSAYDLGPLYAKGLNGKGMTIAIVDSYGSDTIAHDLHVFNTAFGLKSMCGEEDVTCAAGMPTFSQLHVEGSPATIAPPPTSNGTGQENKSAWALEVSLDVETSHAIAPMANILLVTTPTAETLGVQGFPKPGERHLAELRLRRGRFQQLHGSPEPSPRLYLGRRQRSHGARLIGRRRHGQHH